MARDPRYDILFEPVQIGPVRAKNRFYQVPHCNGMGHFRPDALAAMRGMKAEGGWAVVCTEEASIHPTSDPGGWAGGRLWDDRDMPGLARLVDAVHAHGALAGLQPNHSGSHAANALSRLPPMAASGRSSAYDYPVQARTMDKSDIRAFRRWHKEAALRAKRAGVEISTHRDLLAIRAEEVEISCVFTDCRSSLPCDAVVLVTERIPQDDLYQALGAEAPGESFRTLRCAGDGLAPGPIAQAVWDGHRAARQLEGESGDEAYFKREYTVIEGG